jgi:hypothetical protein
MRRILKWRRPSPALVISTIALFVAIGGVAGALPGKNSVDSGDIKNNQVRSKDLKDNNVKGVDVRESSLGIVPNADHANTADDETNVLWAVVSNPAGAADATLVRAGQDGTTVTEGVGVDVDFGRDVSDCSWNATRGLPGAGVETAGFAQTGGSTGNPQAVDVRTRNPNGIITDGNFHLLVVC